MPRLEAAVSGSRAPLKQRKPDDRVMLHTDDLAVINMTAPAMIGCGLMTVDELRTKLEFGSQQVLGSRRTQRHHGSAALT